MTRNEVTMKNGEISVVLTGNDAVKWINDKLRNAPDAAIKAVANLDVVQPAKTRVPVTRSAFKQHNGKKTNHITAKIMKRVKHQNVTIKSLKAMGMTTKQACNGLLYLVTNGKLVKLGKHGGKQLYGLPTPHTVAPQLPKTTTGDVATTDCGSMYAAQQ